MAWRIISNQSEFCLYMCLEYHVFNSVYWPGPYLEVMHLIVFIQTFSESLDVVLVRRFKDVMIRIEVVYYLIVLILVILFDNFWGIFVLWISEGVEASLLHSGCDRGEPRIYPRLIWGTSVPEYFTICRILIYSFVG